MRKKGLKQVVESKDDNRKILLMQKEIKDLQRIIEEKQIKIDFQDKMIAFAETQYKVDIKKISGPSSSGTT